MAVQSTDMPADATLNAINAENITRDAKANESHKAQAEGRPVEKTESDRPDWLQEKFSSPQELAKAYAELEKKLGTESGKPKAPEELNRTLQQQVPERSKEEVQKGDNPEGAHFLPGVENTVAEEISNYAWEHRSLSDEHYETLTKAGYSREIVDEFMAGQFARADTFQNTMVEAGGGAENVEAMFNWARNNLSEQQIAGYDSMFDQGGPQAIMAMENLRAKFENSGQSLGYSGVTGANAAAYETSFFRDTGEVIKAMQDPRYSTSKAYREEVERKLGRSKDVKF